MPTEPYYPTPLRNAALAGILALLVGIGLAFLLDRLDDKVHDPGDVDAVADGLPVIGVIPIDTRDKRGARKVAKGTPRHLVPLDSTTAESYRALAHALWGVDETPWLRQLAFLRQGPLTPEGKGLLEPFIHRFVASLQGLGAVERWYLRRRALQELGARARA